MISTIGVSALQDFRKTPGFEQSIIAGGFVRDCEMGGKFKDIDFFVPYKNHKEFGSLVRQSEFVNLNRVGDDAWDDSYRGFSKREFSKFDARYMDIIDIDIIGVPYDETKEEKSFPDVVLDSFNYNIDKVYFDGTEVTLSKEHVKDVERGWATLCRFPANGIQGMPKSMEKFFRLQKKYPWLMFKSTFEIQEVGKDNNKQETKQTNIYREFIDFGDGPRPIEEFQEAGPAIGVNDWVIIDRPQGAAIAGAGNAQGVANNFVVWQNRRPWNNAENN